MCLYTSTGDGSVYWMEMPLQAIMQKRWTKLRKLNLTLRQVRIYSHILITVSNVNSVPNLMNTIKQSVQHMANCVDYSSKWIILILYVKAFQRNCILQHLQRNLCIQFLHLFGQTVMRTTQFGLCVWKETYIQHTPSPTVCNKNSWKGVKSTWQWCNIYHFTQSSWIQACHKLEL